MMTRTRTLATCAAAIALMGVTPDAQNLSRYRTFALGSDLASVLALTGVASSEAKMVHERPARLQDLEWRLPRWSRGVAVSTDPVERIDFSFYNNQLFRIVVNYGEARTQGMTDADLIEAIAAVYGTPVKGTAGLSRATLRAEADSGTAVARWGDTQHTVVLYRTSSYGDTHRLIVTQLDLEELARKAAIQALRLDELEAPRREIAKQKQERDDARAADEKARIANKGVFLP